MKLSLIIPLYNRPDEIRELLDSLCMQSEGGFEVVVVEDGSEVRSEDIVQGYADRLEVRYFEKPNSGPGQSRNYGAERATGDFLIFLDSDCIIPPQYVQAVQSFLASNPVDAFGGPDRADDSFTPIQKAINYSMTALFTTGGIRGNAKSVEKFHPRSFNMGYTREVFEATGGFAKMRFGEDIDMSIRMMNAGFSTALIPEAYVYHKRRSTFRQFYKQVHNSGIARINLYKRHPKSLKVAHCFPSAFTLGLGVTAAAAALGWLWPTWLLAGYLGLIFLDASRQYRSVRIGGLAVAASAIQLTSYGLGFIKAVWRRLVLGGDEFAAFEKNFYS